MFLLCIQNVAIAFRTLSRRKQVLLRCLFFWHFKVVGIGSKKMLRSFISVTVWHANIPWLLYRSHIVAKWCSLCRVSFWLRCAWSKVQIGKWPISELWLYMGAEVCAANFFAMVGKIVGKIVFSVFFLICIIPSVCRHFLLAVLGYILTLHRQSMPFLVRPCLVGSLPP